MSLAAIYPWIKALHVASALIFVGGVMAVAVFLRAAPRDSRETRSIASAVRRWDHNVTTPAMLLVWTFGLGLAGSGHWFSDIWLAIKLGLVVLLSGIHGVQSGRLRRQSQGATAGPWRAGPLIVASVLGIAILAVTKPF